MNLPARPSKPLNVIVVGGSLGGLFTSIVLTRLGHNVRILERNPTPLLHNQGAGIVAGGDTQAFFRKYDRTQRPLTVTSNARLYLNKKGVIIDEEDRKQQMTSWDLLYYLLRANFDGVDSEYVPAVPKKEEGDGSATYDYGHTVREVKDQGSDAGIEVTFETKDGEKGTTTADMVVAADGPSSTIRKLLRPKAERKYAGYVAFRGTVPETEISDSAGHVFVEKFTFYHSEGIQILAYLIPGEGGALDPGKRFVNWVWYCNSPEDSEDFKALMTDKEGKRHHWTMPVDEMQPEVWERQIDYAKETLPPQFAELVRKTKHPFIQAITDVHPGQASFFDGRVLFIGDALAGFRPHTAASTSQAAFDAMMIGTLMEGKVTLQEWEQETQEYARNGVESGIAMGTRSQFGKHPLSS